MTSSPHCSAGALTASLMLWARCGWLMTAMLVAFWPGAGGGNAAEPGAASAGRPAEPATIESTEALKLQLRPETADDLAKEAAAWRSRLQGKVTEISTVRLKSLQAGESGSVGAELARLQEQRDTLIARLRLVCDEWEKKGGDPKEYRLYATAVSGMEIDFGNARTLAVFVKDWLVSPQGGVRWLGNIIKFLAILFAAYLLSRLLSRLTGQALARVKGASSLLRSFMVNFVRQGTLVLGLVVSLSALEINTSPVLALIGGAAFVIGLALQGTLSNFAHGLLILAYQPFDVGDCIEAGGVSGIVDSMNMLSTTVRTFDNKLMIVPNGKIGGDTITNATASDTRRIDMTFGIGYGDDVDQAQSILERIVTGHPLVLKDPAPLIRMNELADSSVNFIVRPWSKTGDYWTIYWEVMAAVKREFTAAGISIPYPQQDVHVHQVTA